MLLLLDLLLVVVAVVVILHFTATATALPGGVVVDDSVVVVEPSLDNGQGVGEDVSGALEQVVSQEQTPQRMLDTAAHFDQVPEDVTTGVLMGLERLFSNSTLLFPFVALAISKCNL